jgi:hypothetical protein
METGGEESLGLLGFPGPGYAQRGAVPQGWARSSDRLPVWAPIVAPKEQPA